MVNYGLKCYGVKYTAQRHSHKHNTNFNLINKRTQSPHGTFAYAYTISQSQNRLRCCAADYFAVVATVYAMLQSSVYSTCDQNKMWL